MNHITTGFLLPESVLSSSWFIVLATAVAFNTIIYLGLTLSKLIPWPHQIHPDNVRRLLRKDANDAPTEGNMNFPSDYERPESDDPFIALRLRLTRSGIQQGFALIGGLILMLSILTLVFVPQASWVEHIFTFGIGAIFLGLGLVATHRAAKTSTLIWIWSLAALALSALMLWLTIRNENTATLAYLLVILVGLPQVTLRWKSFFLTCALIYAMLVIGTESIDTQYDVQWLFAGLAAITTGGVLMRLRMAAVTSIVEEAQRADFVATTDPLTGVLTRQGISTLLPGLGSLAQRNDQLVAVAFVDVDDLQRTNTEYGLNFGDDILRAVAKAIQDTVRKSDYVARWDGDAFLVAGMSNQVPPAKLFKERIEAKIDESGINLGKRPTTVTVRTTAGSPQSLTFDELLEQVQNHPTIAVDQ
ncbi:MAG: GGDEF domain-containing protein [Candidatus Nanopelagicales bacterium]|nr:GGDEF domain-containing protein [Candidatus Nanopelagicales bacterium]